MALLSVWAITSCVDFSKDRGISGRIETIWQQCDTALADAIRQASQLGDSVADMTLYAQRRYEQLCIRLRDKQYMVPSNIDSAQWSFHYFDRNGDGTDRERAYFYLARAYRGLKDYPRATVGFLKAAELAERGEGKDTVVWQNSLSQLRYLYLLQIRYEEELNVAMKALSLANKTRVNHAWHLMDIASAYEHLHDTLNSISYCNLSFASAKKEHFPPRYAPVYSHQLALYIKYGQYEHVGTLLGILSGLEPEARPQNYNLAMAKYYEFSGKEDSAVIHYRRYYNTTSLVSGHYEAAAGLQRCYAKRKDFESAAWWGERLYATNDSVIEQRAFEQTERAKAEYQYHRDKEEEESIMRRSERIVFTSVIGLLALLSLLLAVMVHHSRRKKRLMEKIVGKEREVKAAEGEIERLADELQSRNQKMAVMHKVIRSKEKEIEDASAKLALQSRELSEKNEEVEALAAQLDNANKTIEVSKVELEKTIKDLEQRMMLNKELTRLALMGNAVDKAEAVVERFKKAAAGMEQPDPHDWSELANALETSYPGFNEAVQNRMQRHISESLLHTVYLLKIGMRPAQIANIMEAKIQTVWNRVKRAEELWGDLLGLSDSDAHL